MQEFQHQNVNVGAGIIRFRDQRFKKLLKELNVKMTPFWTNKVYNFEVNNNDLKIIIEKLKSNLHLASNLDTVRQYFQKVLDPQTNAKLIVMAGYDDFLNEPAKEYFQKQDIDELFFSWKAISIPWQKFIDKLSSHACINADLETRVTSLQSIQLDDFDNTTYFLLEANYKNLVKVHYYSCKNLIIATTVDDIKRLLPDKLSLYQNIRGQPFFRVFGRIVTSVEPLTKTSVVTNNMLRKIIPLKDDIYMIAYNDNDSALKLLNESNKCVTKKDKLLFYSRLLQEVFLGKKFKLTHIEECFWNTGTHYYVPLNNGNRSDFINQAQHPSKNMLVVGEMVSTTQGWVEGALESVDKVLTS